MSEAKSLLNAKIELDSPFDYNLKQNMPVINDPLGQTHNPASSDCYSHLKIISLWKILKSGDARTHGRTDCG